MFDSISIARRPARIAALALAALASAGAPLAAQAQSAPQADGWQTNLTLYGWFPSFSGATDFPTGSGGPSIHVDADKIIDNLKFTFMGTFDVHNGRWGVFNDLIYMNVGSNKSDTRDFSIGAGSLPASLTASLDYDLKAWVWTVAGEYRVIGTPSYTMDVLAGARMINLDQTLGYGLSGDLGNTGIGDRSGSAGVSKTNWDGIVGVKGRYAFGDKREWFVPYYLDVGTGQSDLTWQGAIGLGYQFSWGAVVALYRYLDYDFGSGSKVEDLSASGPQVGVTFRF
jgi:hypothetical protein